jgi:hypothetical protein
MVGDISMDCAWRWRHQANNVAVLLMADLAGAGLVARYLRAERYGWREECR